MKIKKVVGKIHLWLGLLSGLVVFIVAGTGCIFAFEEELFNLAHREMVYIPEPAAETPSRPLLLLQEISQKALGNRDTITLINVYPERNKAWEFEAFKYDEQKALGSLWDRAGLGWKRVYINPYTGEVNGIKDMQYEFFGVIRSIHQNLFLKHEIGSPIVGTATIIFVIMLISGIILWWPKNKAAAKQRFAFRWKATTKWKRKNYDLHNILGFYAVIFGLFIALTGIVWSFDWWENTVYRMLDGKIARFKLPQNPQPTQAPGEADYILDKVVNDISKTHPRYHRIFLSKNYKSNTLNVGMNFKSSSLWTGYDYYVYELSSGKQIGTLLQSSKTTGQKWRNSNYDLHTGKTLGYAGMTLAFCISMIITSLPVTGFYIWWGRRRKNKRASAIQVRR